MNLFVACPVYRRDHPLHEAAWRATVRHFGGAAVYHRQVGDSDLSRARATLLGAFLREERPWDYLLQVDDDQSWAPRDLERVLALGYPLVGLPCAYKLDPPHPYAGCSTVRGFPGEAPAADGTVRVRYLGGGWILWRRDVFEAMARAYPELGFDTNPPAGERMPSFDFWNGGVVGREKLSEDYWACQLAAAIGFAPRAYLGACSPHWVGDRDDRTNERGTWKAYVPKGYESPDVRQGPERNAAPEPPLYGAAA